jgi:hypothetical protein
MAFMRVTVQNPYGLRGLGAAAEARYGPNFTARNPNEVRPVPAMYPVESAAPGESILEPGNAPRIKWHGGPMRYEPPVHIVRRGAPVRVHSPSGNHHGALHGLGLITPGGEGGSGFRVPNDPNLGLILPHSPLGYGNARSGGFGTNYIAKTPPVGVRIVGSGTVMQLPPEQSSPEVPPTVLSPSGAGTSGAGAITTSPSGQSTQSVPANTTAAALAATQAAASEADFNAALIAAQNGSLTAQQIQYLTPAQQQTVLAAASSAAAASASANVTTPSGTSGGGSTTSTDYFSEITAWLESNSLWSAIPNWGVLAGVGLIYAVITRKKR